MDQEAKLSRAVERTGQDRLEQDMATHYKGRKVGSMATFLLNGDLCTAQKLLRSLFTYQHTTAEQTKAKNVDRTTED